jgi:hypothetical protein
MTREAVLVPGDPRTTLAQTMLAENQAAQRKVDSALELYVLAYAGAREGLDPQAPLRLRATHNLARFLATIGKGLPLSRTLLREASTGALARVERAREFDDRTRADFDRWRGVFTDTVQLSWWLASAK